MTVRRIAFITKVFTGLVWILLKIIRQTNLKEYLQMVLDGRSIDIVKFIKIKVTTMRLARLLLFGLDFCL